MSLFVKIPRPKSSVLVIAIGTIWALVILGSLAFNRDWSYYPQAAVDDEKELSNTGIPQTVIETQVVTQVVTSTVKSTATLKAKPKATFDIARKIAYVSRHVGTTADFKYMADNLQLENVNYFDPSKWYNFRDSKEKFMSIIENGIRDKICSEHDAVFISDALSDGWAFIKGDNPKCKNVVFVVTNRFDYCVRSGDVEEFHKDFSFALNRNDEYRLRIIVNNPFEIEYMKDRGIELPEDVDHPLIRPFGYTTIPPDSGVFEQEKCVLIARVDQDKTLMHNLVRDNTGIDCKVLNGRYGGPRTLSKYQSIVVHLPYQVSIMKMWENLAYGTLMAIPSPRLFTEICDEHSCEQTTDVFETKAVDGDHWYEFVDFYLKGWNECFVQFDSWDELKDILESRRYQKAINTCRDMMMDMRDLNLQAWKEFLESQK